MTKQPGLACVKDESKEIPPKMKSMRVLLRIMILLVKKFVERKWAEFRLTRTLELKMAWGLREFYRAASVEFMFPS